MTFRGVRPSCEYGSVPASPSAGETTSASAAHSAWSMRSNEVALTSASSHGASVGGDARHSRLPNPAFGLDGGSAARERDARRGDARRGPTRDWAGRGGAELFGRAAFRREPAN